MPKRTSASLHHSTEVGMATLTLDMNTDGALPEMSKNRQGELDALTSQQFRDALKARNIQLLTYRQLIAMQGLKSMRRPEG